MAIIQSSVVPRVVVTCRQPEFDQGIIQLLQEEDFDVLYVPLESDATTYAASLKSSIPRSPPGDKSIMIAYGAAANQVLECVSELATSLAGVVYYYPDESIQTANIPHDLKGLFHLAEDSHLEISSHKLFRYPGAAENFADPRSPAYDIVAARLAWSRTLNFIRRTLGIENDLEAIWEEHIALEFAERDAAATMKTMVAEPYVNHIPTMTGGIGAKDLYRFYKDYFIPSNPPSMTMKLISRTVGADRVVDELYFKFCHTNEIPWMLPGVKPTNRDVEVMIVSIVCIRGTKLYHEHIYWDQASVLAQIGLIDATKLPVVGAEGARKVLDEKSQPSNRLISDW